MAKAKNAVPEGFHTVTPQLTLDNAVQAIDWYKKALGAEEMSRAVGPDGKILHADLRVGNSHIMLNDAMMGGKGPKALGGSPASLWIYVEDCDALFNRAVAAGAQTACGALGEIGEQLLGGTFGTLTHPHPGKLADANHKKKITRPEKEERQGGVRE